MSASGTAAYGAAVPTPQEQAGQAAVAALLERSHRVVSWRDDIPTLGWGLVIHTPWRRVVVARTGLEALRWPQDCRDGLRAGTALLEALCEEYPQVATPWASENELLEQPLPIARLRGFVTWALGRGAAQTSWPLGPGLRVMGAWASWPDAVLVEMVEPPDEPSAEPVYQLRVAPRVEV